MNLYTKNIETILSKRIIIFDLMFVSSKKPLKTFADIFKERSMEYDVAYVATSNESVFTIDIKLSTMY